MRLEEWLCTIEDWMRRPVKRRKLHKVALEDVQGIIEIGYSKKSDMINAAYLIHRDDFDKLVHGMPNGAGMLIMQSGFVLPPFLSKYAYPENKCQIDELSATILQETAVFFEHLDSLDKVYAELTASEPVFKAADPRSPSLRAMFSAVVAFLLKRDWRPHMQTALSDRRFSGDWFDKVAARLEEADTERSQRISRS
jgi:hypothetical protein